MSNDVSSLEFTPEYVYCRTCGKDYDSRVIHNHPERHEFHMLDHYTAYCLCGWTATTEAPRPTAQSIYHERPTRLESIGMLSERYQRHLLEDAANE